MIIDANVMIGRWPTRNLKFYSVDDLIQQMNYHNINQAVVFSSISVKHNPIEGNVELMKSISNNLDRIIPCWVVLPTWKIETGRELFSDLKSNQIKIVRVFPQEHNFVLDDWECGDLYKVLETAHIPILLDGPTVSPTQIYSICKKYPELPVILMQSEYALNRNFYMLFSLCPNFYLEISTYYIYYGIEDIVHRFGPSRLIFGSRMPFQEPGAALAIAKMADISQSEQEMILGKNIERLIKGVKM